MNELLSDGSPLFVVGGEERERLDSAVWSAFKQFLFRNLADILSTNESKVDEASDFVWKSVDLTFSVVDAFEKLYALGLLRDAAKADQVDLFKLVKLHDFKIEPVLSTARKLSRWAGRGLPDLLACLARIR
eukprot:SAG31_NODE_29552_length_393_cov_1.051020_1_plen_130_part_11